LGKLGFLNTMLLKTPLYRAKNLNPLIRGGLLSLLFLVLSVELKAQIIESAQEIESTQEIESAPIIESTQVPEPPVATPSTGQFSIQLNENTKSIKGDTLSDQLLPSTVQPNNAVSNFSITIDSNQYINQKKSLSRALLSSMLLPGLGEAYLSKNKMAKAYILTDIGFWVGLGTGIITMDLFLNSARNYAQQYGGLQKREPNVQFLQTMSQYRSYLEKENRRDSYEHTQALLGQEEQDWSIKPTQENYWDFGSAAVPENTQRWEAFNESLKSYGVAKVIRNWMIGGLIVGRMTSFFNTLRIYRKTAQANFDKGAQAQADSRPWIPSGFYTGPLPLGGWSGTLYYQF